jgi:regulatory protein
MRRITAIRAGKGRTKRVNIFLEGNFAFSLNAEIAIKEGLKVGQELSADQIEKLDRSDHFLRCLNTTANLLSYRPRSEFELSDRLRKHGFDDESIEGVITKFKEQGLVDDLAFAQFWKDNRETFSPRSRRLTRVELKRKGIADAIIDQVVETVDDDESAYQAALKKARNLPLSDYQSFRRRLGEYLKRRGFGYGVINRTVERIWQEQREMV